MKKKHLIPLLAMLTAGSMLVLSGCDTDLTTINEEETPIEVEMEEQNLAEGMIMMHTVWTASNGKSLSNANVAIYNDDTMIYSGVTEENGSLATFIIPCNTELVCSVTDNLGNTLAESELVVKLSEDYDGLSIYPAEAPADEDSLARCVLEIPLEKTNLRAALFLTEEGVVNFSNLTPYVEPTSDPEQSLVTEEEDIIVEGSEETQDIEAAEEDIIEEPEAEDSYEEDSYEEDSYEE